MTEDTAADRHRTDRRGFPAAGWLALALLLAAVAPRPAAAQALRYTRPLDVPEEGWVRVPLGPETLRRTGGGGGFRLFGPDGEEVPFRRVAARVRPLRRGVAVAAPAAADDGWWVPLDVAPGPRLHERLLVELETPAEGDAPGAREVRVEGSADGETWRLLVAGELAPVPGAEGRFALSYPATELDRLRLFWPRGEDDAAPPRIAGAAVVEVPPGSSRLSLARPECRAGEASAEASDGAPGGARTVCRLPLGGAGHHLRHLCLLVTSAGPAGYRLLDAEDGRWVSVAEGVWSLPGEDVPRCLRVDLRLSDGSAETEALRLELHAAGEEAPGVREASAELAPEELAFRALRAGVHTLAYGPAVLAGGEVGEAPPRDAAAAGGPVRVEPGPEEATEVPVPAPSFLGPAAAPAPAVAWRETWNVTAEAPEPGQLYRLTLPEVVYEAARPGLPDLRLLRATASAPARSPAAGHDPIPFVRWRPRAPELAAEGRGTVLRGDGGTRRAGLEPAVRGLPLSALVVSALPPGDGEIRRRVRVRWVETTDAFGAAGDGTGDGPGGEGGADGDARGGLSPEEEGGGGVGPWVEWLCRPRPPLPCRVTLALDDVPARRVVLEIDDRGEAPLPSVDLELWRRRDVLLFAWPAAGSAEAIPVLAAGAEGVEAPEPPELEADGGLAALLARPWREAALAVEGAGGDRSGRLGKWAIALALVVALLSLVALLHRILREQADRRFGA